MSEHRCNQVNCDKDAAYRFTWPGRDEDFICKEHAPQLQAIASAMGMYIQIILLQTEAILKTEGAE
jgi:hypothetical protein